MMKKTGIVLVALCLLMTAVMGVASVSADAVTYGDVDGNGRINNRDLGALQQHLGDWADVEIDLEAADVTHDGRVNNRDLGLLQQYLGDWDVSLEPEVSGDDSIFNDTELDWT